MMAGSTPPNGPRPEHPVPYPDNFDTNKDGKIDITELTAFFAYLMSGNGPHAPAAPAPPPAP